MRTSIVVKILMALILASVIGGVYGGSALGQDNDRRQGPQLHGYYDDRGRRVVRPQGYYHPGPAYGPPPVFTVPVPPPGISIFLPFPFDIR